MSATHCSECHRVLTDPVSIAMGIGPECRKNGMIRRAVRVQRSLNFNDHLPMVVGQDTHSKKPLIYRWDGFMWTDGKHRAAEKDLKKWLLKYNLVDKETLRQESHPSAVKEDAS